MRFRAKFQKAQIYIFRSYLLLQTIKQNITKFGLFFENLFQDVYWWS